MAAPVHETMTAAEWAASNPVLRAGTVGFETDSGRSKLGDGATPWFGLRYTNRSNPVPSGLLVASDSYQYAGGVIVTPAESIVERIRNGLSMPAGQVRNLSVSGSMARNHQTGCSYARVWQVLSRKRTSAPYVPDVGALECKWGTNDAIRGTGAAQMLGYDAAVLSAIRRAQAGSVFGHDDASVSRTGTGWTELLWTALGSEPNLNTAHDPNFPWGSGTGCWRSHTVNDQITVTVPADHSGTVDLYLIGSWYGAHFSVLIDGVTVQTGLYSGGLGLDIYAAPLYDERNGMVVSVALTPGAHTVGLKVTSADPGGTGNAGDLRFDSWSIRCHPGTDPLVLLCETPYIPTPGAFWVDVTPAVVRTYNAHHRSVAATVNGGPGRSWPVQVVPTERISTPATFPDGAGHPSRWGAALFAGAVLDAYHSALVPSPNLLWEPSWLLVDDIEPEHGQRTYRANVGPAGATDTFTRANSTTLLGGTWTALRGTWGINGNAGYLTASTGSVFDAQIAVLATAMPNGRISAVINGATGDNYGLAFRAVDANNLITLVQLPTFGNWALRVIEANAITRSVTIAGVPTVGQTVTVDFDGDQISIYFGGVLTTSGVQTVTQHRTATQHGITGPWVSTPGTPRFDNFFYGPPASALDGDWWWDDTANQLTGPLAGNPLVAANWGGSISV